MKCSNCGANYKALDYRCPYCNTPNRRAKALQKHKRSSDIEYSNALIATGNATGNYTVNRVLNRVLLIEAGLFLLLLIVSGVCMFIINGNIKTMSNRQITDRLETLYNEGEFGELNDLMKEHNIRYKSGYEKYTCISDVYGKYQWFCKDRVEFMYGAQQEDINDTSLNLMFNDMAYLLREDSYYSKYLSGNALEYLEECRKDVRAFATGVLGFNDEDMQILLSDYLDDAAYKQLRKAVKARRVSFD